MQYSIKKAQTLLLDYGHSSAFGDNWDLITNLTNDYDITLDYWPFHDDILGVYVKIDQNDVIAVNRNLARDKYLFVIAHLLGHVFLNHGNSLCQKSMLSSSIVQEVQANFFAAELLLPKKVLMNYVGKFPFHELPNKLHVPKDIISCRLNSLEIAT